MMIKMVHMTTALISIGLFSLRGFWVLRESPMMQKKWVKILPHINDTVLLGSAIALAVTMQQYPFAVDWLTAKVIGLVAYIVLGVMALKKAKTTPTRALFIGLAIITFVYILSVAAMKTPLGFLSSMLA